MVLQLARGSIDRNLAEIDLAILFQCSQEILGLFYMCEVYLMKEEDATSNLHFIETIIFIIKLIAMKRLNVMECIRFDILIHCSQKKKRYN